LYIPPLDSPDLRKVQLNLFTFAFKVKSLRI
jgi:hypothetical protein